MKSNSINSKQHLLWTPTWSLQAFVAATFFASGAIMLAGADFMVRIFADMGFGQWLRVVTGIVEIIGAFAIVYPGLASIGGLWLGTTMFFATLANIFALHASPIFSILLGLLNAAIVYLHRDELASYARLVTQHP